MQPRGVVPGLMRLLFTIVNLVIATSASKSRRFGIKHDRFVMWSEDGIQSPVQLLSAEVHYARILPEYWEDRLMRIRAMGFNAIQVCGWPPVPAQRATLCV